MVAIRLNLRWRLDDFESTCWTGEVVRDAFEIDVQDREIIAWHAFAKYGHSGSDVRNIMLEVVENPAFGSIRATTPIEMLSDSGSA